MIEQLITFSADCRLPTAHFALAWAITPAFFWAGAALVSIPIIIHILNRRRFKVVPWAAMEYLLQAMRKNRRRLKFEQWLLLATRCLLLGLLGLALARPLGCDHAAMSALASRQSGLHVIIIDNSLSMAYEAERPDAATHLNHARNLAGRLIGRMAAGGEAVAVITASHPATALIVHPTYDLEAAVQAVERIEQSYTASDLAGAMQIAIQIAREQAHQPARHLHLITDGTRSAWDADRSPALRQLGPELARDYRITHYHLGRPEQWNHAVVDVRPAAALVTTQFSHDFTATVRGYGNAPESLLQWRLEGQTLPGGGMIRPALDTAPQTQSQMVFRRGGPHVISVTLAGEDRLGIDNRRHYVVDVSSQLRVLIVEGQRGIGRLEGSGAFLELALAPPADAGRDGRPTASYAAPELISDLELANKVLTEYRAVILAGVGQLSEMQAEQIRQFVEQGGTLLIFMGEAVRRESYNATLLPRGLMPGPLVQRIAAAGDGESYFFDFRPHGLLHPLLSEFAGVDDSGLDTSPVFTYWQIDLPAETRVERVLDYRHAAPDGRRDPAITAHSLGQGRVVFVSTTANHHWTNLPAKPAYVSLMHELLAGSVRVGDRWMNLEAGQRLELPAGLALLGLPELADPARQPVTLEQRTDESGRTVYRSAPLAEPGIYTLNTGRETLPIAVNTPASESDVRTLESRAIRAALGDIDMIMLEDQLPDLALAERRGADFGWSIMLLVLVLAGVECFMAMSFGHYRRK